MTDQEALAQATSLGWNAPWISAPNLELGEDYIVGDRMFMTRGRGDSWEAAFADARKRARELEKKP